MNTRKYLQPQSWIQSGIRASHDWGSQGTESTRTRSGCNIKKSEKEFKSHSQATKSQFLTVGYHTQTVQLVTFEVVSGSSQMVVSVQGHEDLDVADREHARLSVQRALVPVVVDLLQQQHDVALFEPQFARVLRIEVVQG